MRFYCTMIDFWGSITVYRFIYVDGNALPHKVHLVDSYFESQRIFAGAGNFEHAWKSFGTSNLFTILLQKPSKRYIASLQGWDRLPKGNIKHVVSSTTFCCESDNCRIVKMTILCIRVI